MQITPRTAVHPKGWSIEFHPEAHHYLVNGEKLMSVTTLIQKWFPQFDAEAVAKKKAEREGGSYEALMALWERKRDQAATFGSKAHLMADTIIQKNDPSAADGLVENEREKAFLLAIQEAIVRIGKAYDFVESEKIVFSPDRRVAGTIDLLLRSKATGEFVVADWKTSKEIKFEAYGKEMGMGACKALANCNFNHYSLQISAYGELLTGEGYLPAGGMVRGVLLHLNERPGGQVVCEYVKTKDLRAVAAEILLA